MANEKITIEVDLETGNINSLTQKASVEGKKAGTAFGKNFADSVSQSFVAFAGFAALTATVTKATRAAIEFQTAFTEINTLLPQNAKLTEETANAFRDFAGQFGSTATNQAKAFYQIVSSGITDSAQATQLLEQANELAVGGVTDVNAAIDILTSSLNAFGQENLSSGEAADSLFTAVRLGKTTVDELASSLGKVITPAATLGVTFDEVNASIALLTTRGIATAEATTSLNALFSAFARNVDKLGEEFTQSAISSNGLAATLETLQKRTGGNQQALLELLGRQEAVLAAQVLLSNGVQDLTANLGELENKTGASGEAFRQIAETDAFQFQKAISTINTSLEKLGSNILPTVAKGLNSFADFISNITFSDFANESKSNFETIQTELANLIDQEQVLLRQRQSAIKEGTTASQIRLKQINEEIEANRRLQSQLNQFNQGGPARAPQAAASAVEAPSIAEPQEQAQTGSQAQVRPGSIGLTPTEQLQARSEANLLVLQQAREQELISEQEFQARRQQLILEDEANQLASFDNIASGFELASQRQILTAKNLANTVNSTLSRGFGQAFTNVGVALANGQNAFSAFGNAIKNTLGDVASATGDLFIQQGVGLAVFDKAGGAKLIAQGAVLKLLGGALSASGSSGPSVAGGSAPSGTVTDPVNTTESPVAAQDPLERAESESRVTINIDTFRGDEEEARRVAELLSDFGSKNGTFLTDVRTFA